MSRRFSAAALVAAAIVAIPAQVASATGLVTCDSGSPDTWQPQEKLTAMLKEKGWDVRNVKVDGGCYEVYALDEKRERVEAYFHPVTLERVQPTEK
ncbi:MAG: PepSY domain-containing protein [Steroidobacteraceae bacterium]